MTQKENFYTEEKQKEIQDSTQLIQLIEEKGFNFQVYSNLNNYIQYAIGGDIQNFIDTDSEGRPTLRNGIIKFGYGSNGKPLKNKDSAEIVVLNAFSETEIKAMEERINEIIYKPIKKIKEVEIDGKAYKTDYSILMKKVELYFVQELYNSFSSGNLNNKPIVVKDMQLAEILKVSRNFVNQNMNNVIIGLSQLQIRSYKHKKIMSARAKGIPIPELGIVNIIQKAFHTNGETQITFNDDFATYIGLCSPLQIPKELYTIKNPLAYDIALYLYGQVREKQEDTFKIKVSTLYNTILQIPRYEDIKNTTRNYPKDLYNPIRKAFDILGYGDNDGEKNIEGLKLIQIEYENTDFLNDKGMYDFNKWLDTNLIINMIKAPDYELLRTSRNQYRKLAQATKEKTIKKEIEKRVIEEYQPIIDQKVEEVYKKNFKNSNT